MISVIVPVYKVEPYIRRCIDSILCQSFSDFELILVDDGSPDNCPAICDEYAARDSRIKVIHKENGGLSSARNAGLEVVQSEFVTLIDSDDIVPPCYLEHLYKGLASHNADICICWFHKFEGLVSFDNDYKYAVKRVMSGKDACLNIYSFQDRVSTSACTKLYKTALFDDILYPIGRIHEDEATTHKLLYKANTVVELDESLYYYRKTPNSIMNSPFSIKRYDAVVALHERYQFFLEKQESELTQKTRETLELLIAKSSIRARNACIYNQVPKEYKMSVCKALKLIRDNSCPENFEWFLSLIYPQLIRPYEYWIKIKSLFSKVRLSTRKRQP